MYKADPLLSVVVDVFIVSSCVLFLICARHTTLAVGCQAQIRIDINPSLFIFGFTVGPAPAIVGLPLGGHMEIVGRL